MSAVPVSKPLVGDSINVARMACPGFHPEGVNLIVLGDSPAEIQAGCGLADKLGGL